MTSVWRVGVAGAAWLLVAVASAAAQMAGSASAGLQADTEDDVRAAAGTAP